MVRKVKVVKPKAKPNAKSKAKPKPQFNDPVEYRKVL
jgi:hypothetical protein